MIRMPVAGKYKNGLFTVKLWQFFPIIIKQIITPPGLHQKAAVVNVWYLHVLHPSALHTPQGMQGCLLYTSYYWLNKEDPNYSLCRATENRGQDAHTDGKFNLSQKGCMEIMKLFMTKDEDLYDKTIEDVFDEEVFDSTFWLYWRTMFAFENWHLSLIHI